MEYNFKDIYQSFSISHFTDDKDFLSHYIDLDELRNYESIENDNNVLIKKFKLRISLNKTQKFSDEFIVCDTVEFNCKELKNFDSIIKIAIIKEDIETWLNSENIYNYDFIFTIDDYYDELKKSFYHVLKIKGESVYLQLKNILNSLYKYKKEQFFHFTNNKFNNVFPKVRNYFKIFHSEFYDEEWYRETYNIPNNTDPVFHYLIIGNEKGYDPGPNFSSLDYYELNRDVEQAKVNPLVHYEMYGRKQNRQYKFSKEDIEKRYNAISNSPYFDKEWYVETYGDSITHMDPVDHYIKVGHYQGCNPSPEFDNEEYYECNLDVKAAFMNPLLHYELYGRDEFRIIHVSEIPKRNHYLISHSPYFDEEWYKDAYDLDDVTDLAKHYLEVGFKKKFNPGPDFDALKYYEDHEDAKEMGINPLLHYELYVRYSS